ncbi:putative 3-hydroxybutyryl-CoA dehydrogenase [Helianthus annuus]|nr:putative 3-hydroxybutyryl-CoA dehydrogenase [Helianthus annuus]
MAVAGSDVWLLDKDAGALHGAKGSISNSVQRLVNKGQLSKEVGIKALERLNYTSNLEDLRYADIVIEASVESEDVKKKLFAELDKIVKGSAILASNMSSISIIRLAAATKRPHQVIGMHFMNPPSQVYVNCQKLKTNSLLLADSRDLVHLFCYRRLQMWSADCRHFTSEKTNSTVFIGSWLFQMTN